MKPYPKSQQTRKSRKKVDWSGFASPKMSVVLNENDYRKLKSKIVEIVGQQCEVTTCLETALELLHLHHRKSRGACRLDTFENCYLICFRCHRLIEEKHLKPDWEIIDERRHRLWEKHLRDR